MRLLLVLSLVACTTPALDSPVRTDLASDGSVDAAAGSGCKLVVFFGQSNAGLKGRVSQLTGSDVSIAEPLAAVPWTVVDGNEVNQNNTPLIYDRLQALQPVTDYLGSAGTFGIEQSMGHALNDAQPGQWAIAQYSIGGTALNGSWAAWCPYYPQPTLGSGWGSAAPNMFQSETALVEYAETATGCQLGAFIWQQGEQDATDLISSEQYGLRLAQQIAAERYALGNVSASVPWFIALLNGSNVGKYTANVRAGEESVAVPGVTVVDLDAYALGADREHYTTASIVAIGRVYAAAILGE